MNLNLLTDEELALRYVAGNNRAFDELLRRNQSQLFTYILFVVRDRHVADRQGNPFVPDSVLTGIEATLGDP